MKKQVQRAALLKVLPFFIAAGVAQAAGCNHVIDGAFTSSGEWVTCATSKEILFPPVNGVGGAVLGVDQGVPGQDNNLYLIYDYIGSTTPASFFDVFFEVVPDNHAYLVRIGPNGFAAFERVIGNVAPLDQNGSFLLGAGSGWDALSQADLTLANFHAAMGFGPSVLNSHNHPIAEFSLTIDRSGSGGPGGVYSPDPAFWSASEKSSGGADPPLSSGVFGLNVDGTTTVTKMLDANGAPLMQGSVTDTPEPATACLVGIGVFALVAGRRRVQRELAGR